jgi:transposase
MPAKASGEIKIRIVHQPQKNGDIYVLERRTLYDPVKKYNKVLSSRILSKIPKGEEKPVPTRPKRRKGEEAEISEASSPAVKAVRSKVGMMDIIGHIGDVSGIDAAVYGNTDLGSAQKILSLARYLLATNGQSLPGITVWQYSHPLPYEDGISEDVYHDLFEEVGRDEGLQQNFFASRCARIKGRAVLAYDSTTISTYSGKLPEARRGFNKAGDGLDTVKLLTLYSIETRQPVAFTKQPGNLPDVITIENALKQLDVLGLGKAEIITDNGYYSEKNLAELLHAHFDFITLVKVNIKWVKKELDAHSGEFRSTSSACPFDTNTHGITVMMMHEFSRTRKYAGRKTGMKKGDEEAFTRRVYLHLFFNPIKRVEEDVAFDKDLFELKGILEEGKAVEELSDNAQYKASRFLYIRHYGSKVTVSFNEKAIAEQKEYHGYFTLVSNCEKDPFECLRKYRRRETIESFFEFGKQHTDGSRTRVWSAGTLRGRMFVQFVSLCYYEYLNETIRQMKSTLAKKNGDPDHDKKDNLTMETKLKTWLQNTPVYLTLQWFDTVEEVKVSTKLLSKRWTTEITQRDRMFLNKLGVIPT